MTKNIGVSDTLLRVLDKLPEAVAIFNKQCEYIFLNKKAALLLQRKRNEIIGHHLLEFFPGGDSSPVYMQLIDAMKKKRHGQDTYFSDLSNQMLEVAYFPFSEGIMVVYRRIDDKEQQLHETRSQLEAVLANVEDGILVQDTLGKILFVNRVALRLFGRSSLAEVRNKGMFYQDQFSFYDEEGNPFPFSRFPGRRVIAGEKKAIETFRIVDKNTGKTVWLTVTSTAVYEKKSKKPILVVSVLSNITHRKQTEDSLRFLAYAGNVLSATLDFERTLQQVATLSIEFIADWCSVEVLRNGKVEMVAIAHKDPEQVRWAKQLRKQNPIDLSAKTGLAKVLRTGNPAFYPIITDEMLVSAAQNKKELTVLRKLGFLSRIIVPIFVAGKTIGVIQLVSTTSKRYFTSVEYNTAVQLANRVSLALENSQLYENLQKEQERITDIISNIPGVVWEAHVAKSSQHKIVLRLTYLSKFVETLLGYAEEQLLGNTKIWKEIVYPEDKEKFFAEIASFYKARKGGTLQCRFITKAKQVVWIEMQCKPILDTATKHMLGFRGVAMDITRQKEIEQRKDDFVSMASHELKTPLTSTKVFAQILQKAFKNKKDTTSEKFIIRMNEQIDKLTDLVRDMLDVTRMQQGKMLLKKEKFLLKDLLDELIENIQPATDHQLVLEVQKGTIIWADREKIRQVMTNFLTNAIKYSPEDKDIIIRSQRRSRNIVVSVQDFGIGIQKNEQPKIFDRFFQASNPSSIGNTYPGLGLGLYISSEIIKLHKGKIWVESEEGKGSIFYFSLPLKMSEE